MQNWLFDIRSRSFVLLTILFFILSAFVYFGVTESFDQSVIFFFSQHVGNPTLDIIMQYITESGDVFNMMVFGIVMLIIPKTRRIGITLMILIVLSTLLTGYIKCGVDRDRPDFEYEGVAFPVEISRDTYALFCEGSFNASYPSDTALAAVIQAGQRGRLYAGRNHSGAQSAGGNFRYCFCRAGLGRTLD